MGPAASGHAYTDGNGTPPAGLYLNALWLESGRDLPAAPASGGLSPGSPGAARFASVNP